MDVDNANSIPKGKEASTGQPQLLFDQEIARQYINFYGQEGKIDDYIVKCIGRIKEQDEMWHIKKTQSAIHRILQTVVKTEEENRREIKTYPDHIREVYTHPDLCPERERVIRELCTMNRIEHQHIPIFGQNKNWLFLKDFHTGIPHEDDDLVKPQGCLRGGCKPTGEVVRSGGVYKERLVKGEAPATPIEETHIKLHTTKPRIWKGMSEEDVIKLYDNTITRIEAKLMFIIDIPKDLNKDSQHEIRKYLKVQPIPVFTVNQGKWVEKEETLVGGDQDILEMQVEDFMTFKEKTRIIFNFTYRNQWSQQQEK